MKSAPETMELSKEDLEWMRQREKDISEAMAVAPEEIREAYESANKLTNKLMADKDNMDLELVGLAANISFNLEEWAIARKQMASARRAAFNSIVASLKARK